MAKYCLDNPQTEILVGDCRQVVPTLPDGAFDLVFADPPYNFGVGYDGWDDSLARNQYIEFTYQWLELVIPKLSPRGSLFVLVPDEIVSFIDIYATLEFRLTRINWLLWHYRFGQCQDSRFIRSKAHLPYYARNAASRIWHPDSILEPSDRASKYNDPRTAQSRTPGLRMPLDVVYGENLGRIQGNNAERRPEHPNQVPEKLLELILRPCTEPDSWVLDPFVGSGTTCVVARALGLRSIGIDISDSYAQSAHARVQRGAVRVSSCSPPDSAGQTR